MPYGAESYILPTAASCPAACLIAYAVTGESASIASALPLTTALVASSWPSYLCTAIAVLPASVHFLLRAGRSSVSCTVVACTATLCPQASSGSNVVPVLAAHEVPALKYVTKSTTCSRFLLSVNEEMPSSYFEPSEGMMLSNLDAGKSADNPSFLPMGVPRSTSKPMMVPLVSLNSFGAYVGSVPMAIFPSAETEAGTLLASASSLGMAFRSRPVLLFGAVG